MSEVEKSSANQEAARAAQLAEQKKSKQTEKSAIQHGAQQKGYAGEGKKLKSSFEEVLKNAAEPYAPVLGQEVKFDSRLKEVQRDQDRSGDRERDDDRRDTKKSEGKKESRESASSGRDRVLSKHGSGEQKQDSGGRSGEQKEGKSGQSFSQQRFQEGQQLSAGLRKSQVAPAPVPEMPRPQLEATIPMEKAATPLKLPKAVLDQIIQYVRIGLNKDLDQEMQIDFHDQVFNGLKLKVTSHKKEIRLELIAPNRAVRECFQQEREKLALALGEKGIDVRSITVTMRS